MITRVSLTMKLGNSSSVSTEARNKSKHLQQPFSKCNICSSVFHWLLGLFNSDSWAACWSSFCVQTSQVVWCMSLHVFQKPFSLQCHNCSSRRLEQSSGNWCKAFISAKVYSYMNETFRVFRSLLLFYENHLLHKISILIFQRRLLICGEAAVQTNIHRNILNRKVGHVSELEIQWNSS